MRVFILAAAALALAVSCATEEAATPEPTSTPTVQAQTETTTPEPEATTGTGAPQETGPCYLAFWEAAQVPDTQDTVADLYPTGVWCETVDDWEANAAKFPAALDGADPETFRRNMCLYGELMIEGVTVQLSDSPLCADFG